MLLIYLLNSLILNNLYQKLNKKKVNNFNYYNNSKLMVNFFNFYSFTFKDAKKGKTNWD